MAENALDEKYTEFIEGLISKLKPLLPADVNKLQEDYLVSNIRKTATLMASSMDKAEEFKKLEFENQCFYIQVIAEWSFHKEIDLFRSGIPPKYWKVVMQKIWYTTWEVMYACVKNNAPESVVLSLVERFVNRVYNDAIDELKAQKLIDEKIEEKAKEQSNIEVMAQEIRTARKISNNIKEIIKKIFLAIVICIIVSFLILKFKTAGLIIVLTFLAVYRVFPNNKD